MRGADHVRMPEKRVFGCRLNLEDIQSRRRDLPRIQRRQKRRLVNQPAARAVDDPHALLGLRKVLGRQDIAGLVGQRHMQGDEIGAVEQILQLDFGHAKRPGPLVRQEGIIGDHLHLQPHGAIAYDAANIAGTDHAKGLVEQLHPHKARLFPFPGLGRGIGLRDLTRDGKHHRDGMFGGGDRIAKRRVHHDHPFFCGRRDIDVIDANPCPAHDLQPRGKTQQLFGHLGGRTDRQPIILANDFSQLVFILAEFRQVINLDPSIAKDLHGGFGKLIGNENAGGHVGSCKIGGGGSGRAPDLRTIGRRFHCGRRGQSKASARRHRRLPPLIRTRCADPPARRGRRRCHRRPRPFPAV